MSLQDALFNFGLTSRAWKQDNITKQAAGRLESAENDHH